MTIINPDELAEALAWRLVELIEDKANKNLGWDPDGELIQKMKGAVEYAIKQTPTVEARRV